VGRVKGRVESMLGRGKRRDKYKWKMNKEGNRRGKGIEEGEAGSRERESQSPISRNFESATELALFIWATNITCF